MPFGPGGITDLIARQAALGMAEKLGQPVIIENKPSAGHIVAMQTVAQATPDGYTILLGSNTGFTVAPHMYKNLPFRIDTLQPIAPINTAPTVLLARPDFPANNLTELIQYIKDNPGKLNYGSFGIGTSAHLGMEIMKSDLGLNIMHIPYRGDAQGLLALKARKWTSPISRCSRPRRASGPENSRRWGAAERPPHGLSRHPDHRRSRLEELGHAGLDRLLRPARHA